MKYKGLKNWRGSILDISMQKAVGVVFYHEYCSSKQSSSNSIPRQLKAL